MVFYAITVILFHISSCLYLSSSVFALHASLFDSFSVTVIRQLSGGALGWGGGWRGGGGAREWIYRQKILQNYKRMETVSHSRQESNFVAFRHKPHMLYRCSCSSFRLMRQILQPEARETVSRRKHRERSQCPLQDCDSLCRSSIRLEIDLQQPFYLPNTNEKICACVQIVIT